MHNGAVGEIELGVGRNLCRCHRGGRSGRRGRARERAKKEHLRVEVRVDTLAIKIGAQLEFGAQGVARP